MRTGEDECLRRRFFCDRLSTILTYNANKQRIHKPSGEKDNEFYIRRKAEFIKNKQTKTSF